MDLELEREKFLYELNGRGYNFENTDWCGDWNRFEDDHLNMVWEIWLASRNREGYVLVPTPELKVILSCVTPDDMNLYDDVYKANDVIEKAMMEVCDE